VFWASGFSGVVAPGAEDRVRGSGCDCGFGRGEQAAADQPRYGGLRRAFGDPDGFREFLIADFDCRFSILLLNREPQVDEEAYRAPVVADEVAHEDVGYVGVERGHRYTNYYYRNP